MYKLTVQCAIITIQVDSYVHLYISWRHGTQEQLLSISGCGRVYLRSPGRAQEQLLKLMDMDTYFYDDHTEHKNSYSNNRIWPCIYKSTLQSARKTVHIMDMVLYIYLEIRITHSFVSWTFSNLKYVWVLPFFIANILQVM